jgi:hypothetical protein
MKGKRIGKGVPAIVFALLLGVALARPATANSFADNSITWDGWARDSQWNTTDVLGLPDITGWNFTLNGNTLESINIDYNRGHGSYNTATYSWISYAWSLLRAGDLFIGVIPKGQSFSAWNYVFVSGGSPSGLAQGLYKFNSPLDVVPSGTPGSPGYAYYVTKDDQGLFDTDTKYNWDYRNHHPWALKNTSIVTPENLVGSGSASFSWDKLPYASTTTGQALFAGLGIALDPATVAGIQIGFTFNCANDVLYEGTTIPLEAVPEPATLLLLGSGLVGVFVNRRRLLGSQSPA